MPIGPDSRLNRSAILVLRDQFGRLVRRPFFDLYPRLENILKPSNRRYMVKLGDTWNLLAFRSLGNSRHWWGIAEYNNIVDAFEDGLSEGNRLFLPSETDFQFNVLDFEEVEELEGEV